MRRAAAAVIGVAVVVGPALAVGLWASQRRWRWPSMAEVRAATQEPPGAGLILAVLGCVAVIAWLLLAYYLGYRAWLTMRYRLRQLRRLPLPTPAQMTAGSMAGVAALAMPGIVVQHPDGPAAAAAEYTGPAVTGSPSHTTHAGIDLPGGGWVPYSTALAVSAVGNLVWLHRRRHYQPRDPRDPRFGRHDDDADLQPLPHIAQAIIAGTGDAPAPPAAPAAALLPVGDLPPGLLSWHGPGALNAARGLLITTLLSAALSDPPQQTVTLGSRDLALLLGVPDHTDLPRGLHLHDTTAPAADPARPGETAGPPATATMLVTRSPSHRTARRPGPGTAGPDDTTTIAVVTEPASTGLNWHVTADGRAATEGPEPGQRLCILDRQAAQDLLKLLQQYTRSATSSPAPVAEPTPLQPQPPGQLRLLGGCSLHAGDDTVHIRRSAGLQVLAYLALHPDGATTSELLRAIWPGLNPNTITKRLHTTLTDLRQHLPPALPDAIIRHDNRYRLNPASISTDLDRLRQAITAAATATTSRERQTTAQAITGSYHGELAAGYSWPWLQPLREAVRRDVIDAYLQLAATAPPGEALQLVRAALAADPYNQALHEQAHHLLTAIGEHDAARTLRHALRQRLLNAGLRPAQTATGSADKPDPAGR